MLHEMFTIYDSKVESYSPPYTAITRGSAIRSFTDTCNDPNTMLHAHPEDFTLFYMGVFDGSTGGILLEPTLISLGLALNFKKES